MELRQLLNVLWRRRALLFTVFLVVFVGVSAVTLLCETQYVSSAKVYVYHSSAKAGMLARAGMDSTISNAASLNDTERATFEDLAITRPVVDPVIEEMHLTRKRGILHLVEFIPFVRMILDHYAPNFGRRPLTFEDLVKKSIVHYFFPRPYVKAAMMEDTDILEFSTMTDSIGLSVDLANALAKSFVDMETAMRQAESKELAESVARELPRYREEYKQALLEQQKIHQDERIVDMASEAQKLVDKFYSLTGERDSNNVTIIKTKALLASIKAQMAKRPEYRKASETTQRSSLVDAVKLTLRDLYLDMAATKTKFTADHPAVKDIENKIAEAKKMLKDEALKSFGSETVTTDSLYNTLLDKASDYTAQITGNESLNEAYDILIAKCLKDSKEFSRRSTASSLIAARVDTALSFLNTLEQLEKEARAAQNTNSSLCHVVEEAKIPAKLTDYMRPKLSIVLAVGFVLAVLLGGVAALAAEYADDSVHDREDVAACGGEYLGRVGERDDPTLAEGVRQLRDALFTADGSGPAACVLTCVDAGDRCMPLALELAEAVAREGRQAVLVDGDLSGPSLGSLMELPAGPGLVEAATGRFPLDAVLVPSRENALTLVLAGQAATAADAPDPVRLLESPAMRAVLAELASRSRTVFVAAAPLARRGDARAYARAMGATVLLLASAYRTGRTELRATVEQVKAATGRAPLVAIMGAPTDDRTPAEEWRRLRHWYRCKLRRQAVA